MENSKTTLWSLLKKYCVVIPIIQRDYAQGRRDEGKDELRNRFLTNLTTALKEKNNPVKLDFVYGSVENGELLPLDGQQRLTTLWLLHWYVAFRAGKLKEAPVRQRLLRFRYTTRNSSELFCARLVEKFADVAPAGVGSVVEYINSQNWFYSSYQHDPTIKSMLVMLGGDSSSEKYPDRNGIEQFLLPTDEHTFYQYWEKLTGDDCPIQFYHKDMLDDNMPLTDDLYVKMNARGIQLTHFENFKAELVGYSYDTAEGKHVKLLDIEAKDAIDLQFVCCLDNDWIRVFWPYKHKKYNKVDEIYFQFIRQYMLAFYFVNAKETDGIDNTETYKILQSSRFGKIEDYAELLTPDFKSRFYNTLNGIVSYGKSINDGLNDHIKRVSPYWTDDFIPTYPKDNELDPEHLQTSSLKQIPFVIFFAICKFFERQECCKDEHCTQDIGDVDRRLKDWLRFCNNICYNPHVENVAGQLAAIRLIDSLAEQNYCLDVYSELGKKDCLPNFGLKTAAEQLEEEWQKAKAQSVHEDLKSRFEQAERHSFFNGSIRFLLWNEEGEYRFTLESFEKKFCKVQQIFPQDRNYTLEGIVKDSKPFQNYFNACHALNEICAESNDGGSVIRFDGHGYSWKQMLNNKQLAKTTHSFLETELLDAESLRRQELPLPNLNRQPEDEETNKRLQFLCDIVFENDFVVHLSTHPLHVTDGLLFLRRWFFWSLYPLRAKSDQKIVQIGTSRNKVLADLLKAQKITTGRNVESSMICWGWNIPFVYKDHNFEWTWDSQIIIKDADDMETKMNIGFDIETQALLEVLDELVKLTTS